MPHNKQVVERLKFAIVRFGVFFIIGFGISQSLAYYFKQSYNWLVTIDNNIIIAELLTLSCIISQNWLFEYSDFKIIGKFKVTVISLLLAFYGLLFLVWQWLIYFDITWFFDVSNKYDFFKIENFYAIIQSVTANDKTKFIGLITLVTLLYLLASTIRNPSKSDHWAFSIFSVIILFFQYHFNLYFFYLTIALVFTFFFAGNVNYDNFFYKTKIKNIKEVDSHVSSMLYKMLKIFNNTDGVLTIFLVIFIVVESALKLLVINYLSWWHIIITGVAGFIVITAAVTTVRNCLMPTLINALLFSVANNKAYHQKAVEALINAQLPTNVSKIAQKANIQVRNELVKAMQQGLPDIATPSFEINRVNEERATQQSQQSSPDTNNQAPKPSSSSKEAESTNSGDVRNPFPFDFESISTLSKKMAGVFTNKETYPENLTEKEVVQLAYNHEIQNIASVLKVRLSVLVSCDKLVVEHLWQAIIKESELKPIVLQVSDLNTQSSLLRGQLSLMRQQIETMKTGEVLVVPHLDLLAGGSTYLSEDAREFVELIYRASDHCILAFTDVSLDIPEVLAARFSTRKSINGVPRTVTLGAETILLGQAFITATEVKRIKDYDAEGLYKNISGMNPLQIRHAIVYAIQAYSGKSEMTMEQLYQSIRDFKAKTSSNFEIPDVSFDDIGGYDNVKAELSTAIELLEGTYRLSDEKLKKELIPRGFIFHGRPGTGKTLFAKAVANRLQATVMVVSGPETIDKWLGESERKVRELFAEARRNAPSVLIFDEFDAIAGKRTNSNDGGSRAINSMVAQILTEMDGFRPDVPMLVIGTTNRLDIIDDAFLRPSRFQAIAIDLPDKIARRSIAGIYAKKFQVTVSDEVLDAIAETTQGFNGDEMQAIFRNVLIDMVKSGNAQLPVQADPNRLGQLVGAMRRSKTEQHRGGVVTISLN